MRRMFTRLLLFVTALSTAAFADTFPIGFVSWDVSIPRSTGAFDITNLSGPNSTLDSTAPVVTAVSLSSLSLAVTFQNGTTTAFGSSYFTLGLDGLSFNGTAIPIGGTNPEPIEAELTGTFSPTSISLFDGSTHTIASTFSATILPSSGVFLQDGDFAVIDATTTTTSPVPETSALIPLALVLGFFALRNSRVRRRVPNFEHLSAPGWGFFALLSCLGVLALPAHAVTVKLNVATTPSTGVAGVDFVNIVGSGFPSASIPPGNVTISFSLTCGGAVAATTSPVTVQTVFGSIRRLHVQLPGTLATADYFASVSGTASDGTAFDSGTTCSEVSVTHTNSVLSACLPSSSLGVLSPTNPGPVTAYVPNGYWSSANTGLRVVPLEGGGSPAAIPTPHVVNSCSSNPATGETVCTANNTDVYLITGTTLNTTLTSGATGTAHFSGGSCNNCGVAINALSNKAVINMGLTGIPAQGFQVLDLNTNTFLAPTPSVNSVTENMSIDPTRGLVLSPSENFFAPGSYDLFQVDPITGALTEFQNKSGALANSFLDSAAEDCSTGIGLSTDEATVQLFITDLSQATFTAGSPGAWSAPGQFQSFPEFSGMGAGTSGISVAPGTAHLGIVSGEFGSNRIGVIQLPSTSGSGTPSVVDYAATNLDSTFSLGFDPHTLTAYTSPNSGKALGVLADFRTGLPARLAVVDLACLITAPRTTLHNVDPTVAAGCITYVATQ